MVGELVHIIGDAAAGFVLAEAVRQVDVDGLTYICDVGQCSALFKLRAPTMLAIMRIMASIALIIASPVGAQTTPMPQSVTTPAAEPATPINPAAPYITAGQDEPGYRSWYLSDPSRAQLVKSFNDYLNGAQVAGIVPTWQLFRTATSWKDCGAQPFEVPPTSEWPHIINTLRYVRDFVIPELGPVEPVSVYRNPALNLCAGGAPESAHKLYSAIDMVPLRPITREAMMRALCGDHSRRGADYQAGLGFYAFMRFHVDSTKYRRWNMDPAVAAECPPLIHPEDAATIGQPLPQPATTPSQPASESTTTDPHQSNR